MQNRHNLFDDKIGDNPAIDLIILLADFNDRGKRGPLIELTHELAGKFKKSLDSREIGKRIGSILCSRWKLEDLKIENHFILYGGYRRSNKFARHLVFRVTCAFLANLLMEVFTRSQSLQHRTANKTRSIPITAFANP